MFEDLQSLFSDIKTNIDEILVNKENLNLDRMGIEQAVAEILSEALVEAGRKSIEKVKEFQYPPLRDRLLENLSKPEHVITSRGTVRQQILYEKAIGDYGDLISGQEAAGGHTGTPQAPAVWKYGIYMPSQGSGGWSSNSKLELPTYEEIIDQRLSAWGDKAPYWYFLENGNAGSSRAYPNFSGTGYFSQLRSKTREIVTKARQYFSQRLFYDLESAINLGINIEPKSRTRVTIYRYTIGSTNISIQKTSSGKIFYRIGNKTYTVDEFKNIVRSLI